MELKQFLKDIGMSMRYLSRISDVPYITLRKYHDNLGAETKSKVLSALKEYDDSLAEKISRLEI